jgi:hypothetical protein
MFAYIVPASTISCSTGVTKNREESFGLIAHIELLKLLKEDVAQPGLLLEAILAELVNTRPGREGENQCKYTCPDIDRLIKTVTRDSPLV